MIKLTYCTFIICAFALLGCTHTTEVRTLGETEYYFNEKLASLSIDTDQSCWIGSETGDIINHKKESRVSYQLGEDRIYKVLRADSVLQDPEYWIGVRNSGLQLWNLSLGTPTKTKTYSIPHKGYKYSPYDFVQSGDTLYVATSQGLYATHRKNSGELSLVFPTNEVLEHQNGYTFLIPNLKLIEHRLLLASSPTGILSYNLITRKQHLFLPNQPVDYVTYYNRHIFALSAGFLYEINEAGQILQITEVGESYKVYHQIEGIHYFIGSHEILLSNNLKTFTSFKLRRSIPLFSRNVIASDAENGFTFLLTNKAMWRISNHIDIFKGGNPIHLSTSSNLGHYFLDSNNQLFHLNKGDSIAKWTYALPQIDEVKWIQSLDRTLYYYTSNDELKRVKLSRNGLKNRLYNPPKTILKSNAKITACSVQQMGEEKYAYVGIQDGLIRLNIDNKIDTVVGFNDKYITAMFSHDTSDELYLATLNHGIFYMNANQEVDHIQPTEKWAFINDIATTSGYEKNLLLLTNHQLISARTQDSIAVKGYQKLLYANDSTLYAMPEFGVHKFRLSGGKLRSLGVFYNDIRFTKWASTALNGELFLGSSLGVLHFKVDQENNSSWVEIPRQNPLNNYLALLLMLLLTVIAGTGGLFLVYRKRDSQRYMASKKEDLCERLLDLKTFYEMLNIADHVTIQKLENRIEGIDPNLRNKGTKSEINTISTELTNLNREATLLLPQKIQHQLEKLEVSNFADASSLIQRTLLAQQANNIETIKLRVIENDAWIARTQEVEVLVLDRIKQLNGIIEIDEFTQGLRASFIELYEARTRLSFSNLEQQLATLCHQYNQIESSFGADKALLVATQFQEKATLLKNDFPNEASIVTSALVRLTEKINNQSIFDVLRHMSSINSELMALENINYLKDAMQLYSHKRKQLVAENEQLINKKFDTDLDNYLAEQLRKEIQAIGASIDRFYTNVTPPTSTLFTDVLKFSNYDEQQPKVLALLLAHAKVKRTFIPGMLDVYGNLNPVISRLVNSKIKTNMHELTQLAKDADTPSVVALLILDLLNG